MAELQNLPIESPFLQKARDCYLNRRRHSKKIRKLVASFSKTNSSGAAGRRQRTNRDPDSSAVINLLSGRNIPPMLLELLRKKRIWNVGCIRKMGFSPNTEDALLSSPDFMNQERRRQEEELQKILQENESRFEEKRKIADALRLTRKLTVTTVASANSSTLSLDDSQSEGSHMQSVNYLGEMEGTSQSAESQPNNPFEFQGPLDFMARDLDEDNLFVEMF